MKKKADKAEPKSIGTTVAEKVRAKANKYTDEQRQTLLEQGLAMIYGGAKHAKSTAGRR